MLSITTPIQLCVGSTKGQLNDVRKNKMRPMDIMKEEAVILQSLFIVYPENLRSQRIFR